MSALVRFAAAVTVLALCSLPAALAAQQPADPDAEKSTLVRQLLERMGAADQLVAAMEAGLPAQRAANPRIPAVFWDRFLAEARERRGELVDSLVPIYTRTFTIDDLRAIVAFYDSPTGRRLLETQPALMREATALGQAWGSRIGAEIGRQLASEGIVIQP